MASVDPASLKAVKINQQKSLKFGSMQGVLFPVSGLSKAISDHQTKQIFSFSFFLDLSFYFGDTE